jgi:hypothetical protein
MPALTATLDPGEEIKVFCDFSAPDPKGSIFVVHRTLVLTNRNLRALSGKKQFSPWGTTKKAVPLAFSAAIPLAAIQGIAVELGSSETRLDVRWSGGNEVWKSFYDHSLVFVKHLQDRLAQKTASEMGTGMADELGRLAELVASGVLTQDEFERGKAMFLGSPPDEKEQSILLLRQLHGLYESGVLSESEFNMKKWDVLSRTR